MDPKAGLWITCDQAFFPSGRERDLKGKGGEGLSKGTYF